MSGMGVGNLSNMGTSPLGMGIPGLGNVAAVTSVGNNLQTGDALTQAYSGIQQYNGKYDVFCTRDSMKPRGRGVGRVCSLDFQFSAFKVGQSYILSMSCS